MTFSATLFVAPFGKQRPRFTKAGFAYTPKETRNKEAELRYWLVQSGATLFPDGPLALKMTCFFARPKSKSKKVLYPTVKPDLDNVLKTILDAGNGLLFRDDALVVSATVTKVYGEPERIELEVKAFAETA